MPNLCSVCLSQDRTLKTLYSIAQYVKTLEWLKLDFLRPWSKFCWECEADLSRVNRFRRRAWHAHKILQLVQGLSPQQSQEQLTCLSNLSMATLYQKNQPYINYDDIIEQSHINKNIFDKHETHCDEVTVKEEIIPITEITKTEHFECDRMENSSNTDFGLYVKSNPCQSDPLVLEVAPLAAGSTEHLNEDTAKPYEVFIVKHRPRNGNSIDKDTYANSNPNVSIKHENDLYTKILPKNSAPPPSPVNTILKEILSKKSKVTSSPTTNDATIFHKSLRKIAPNEQSPSKVAKSNIAIDNWNLPGSNIKVNVVATSAEPTDVQNGTNSVKTQASNFYISPAPSDENTAYKVVKISEEDIIKQREMANNDQTYKSNRFNCELCIQSFVSVMEYNLHVLQFHEPNKRPFACPICSTCFDNEEKLTQHRADHTNLYECLKCSYQTHLKETIHAHLQQTHNIFLCAYCFKQFESDSDLTDHVVQAHMSRKKQPTRVKCSKCEKTFSYSYKLQAHMQTHIDTEIRQKQCPHCYKKVINLSLHITTYHTRNKATYCETCNKQFKHITTYNKHLKTSHKHNPDLPKIEESYCETCSKQFRSVETYESHLKTSLIHNPNQPKLECEHCCKEFKTGSNLRSHVKIVHKRVRAFVCDTCGFAAAVRSQLRIHIQRKHEGTSANANRKRDKICQYCGRGFYTTNMLSCHIRTHTGEKMYHCAHCPWKFSTRGPFVTHLRGKHPEVVTPKNKLK